MAETRPRRVLWTIVRLAVFHAGYTACVAGLVDLYVHAGVGEHVPVFRTGLPYLLEKLVCPGGFLDYLTGLLSLGLESAWGGPLVVAAVALLSVIGLDALLRAVGAGSGPSPCCPPW